MRKDANNQDINDVSPKEDSRIDDIDLKVISLLISGRDNRQISRELGIPLSTVQRRTRKIFAKKLVNAKVEPNYMLLGYKRGLIHVYLENGDIRTIAEKLAGLKGIISVTAHIGNSDIVGEFVYRNSRQILDLTEKIKAIHGVERTLWSEVVYEIPVEKQGRDVAFPFTEISVKRTG